MDINRTSILQGLKKIKPTLEDTFGISDIALFGSYANGTATEESDIDILIMKMNRKNGFTIVKAQHFISDYFHKKVDIGLWDAIRPIFKESIEREMIHV